MARRFIVKSNDLNVIDNNHFVITGSEVKHIQVLRHNIDDELVINKYVCKITKMTKDSVEVDVLKEAEQKGIPNINVTLYMAMLKNDKMDYVVQKAVELGVKKIVPFFSSNVIVKLDEKGKSKRREKLQVIADEACKQCGRTDEVEVADFLSFKQMLNDLKENNMNIFAYENNNEENSFRNSLNVCKEKGYKNIGYIVGAEGGFEPKEAEEIASLDSVKTISLGERILRAETAALNIVSVIMYELDI